VNKNVLKVGLIVDSFKISQQLKVLMDLSKSSEHYEINTIIIQNVKSKNESCWGSFFRLCRVRGLNEFLHICGYAAIMKLEKFIIKRNKNFKDFFNSHEIETSSFEVLKLTPRISKSGLFYRYEDVDIDLIKEKNLDLLIRGGSGILRGDILKASRFGIISLHHADNNVNRGGPPGFWEVFYKIRRTGFIVQILNERLDGGTVVSKGYVATSYIASLNYIKVYKKSIPFLHKAIERIAKRREIHVSADPEPYGQKLYKTPNLFQQLKYCITVFLTVCKKSLLNKFGYSERWSFGFIRSDNWKEISLRDVNIVENPPNRFLADPFTFRQNNVDYCFVEDYDYDTNVGHISVYEIGDNNVKALGSALREDFHLSFPYVFSFGDEIYMCPETSSCGDIRLYRAIDFPNNWEVCEILMSDISAADTQIFHFDKRWWLFTNMCSSNIGDHNSELHIFHSEKLIDGTWIPHPKNPVIFDSNQARNGGLIFDDDKIYRTFQRQGFDLYGEGFGIAEIVTLSEDDYVENQLCQIDPCFLPNIKGTHSFNYANNLAVFDFKKIEKKRT
jgi:hypothetical protein